MLLKEAGSENFTTKPGAGVFHKSLSPSKQERGISLDLVMHTESMGVLLLQQTLACSGVRRNVGKKRSDSRDSHKLHALHKANSDWGTTTELRRATCVLLTQGSYKNGRVPSTATPTTSGGRETISNEYQIKLQL